MTKLSATLLSVIVATAMGIPALASQEASRATSIMAVGNPHPAARSSTQDGVRAEARRHAQLAEWQGLLGGGQPYPAMGVGGHAR
jgi:hypothetical protein